MAKNEPNNPEDVKITPENEQTESVAEAPAPEMTAEKAATLANEGEAALREMGEEQLEPPAPFDISGEHVTDPGDVIVPSDKIPETEQEAEPPAAPEKLEAKKTDKAPKKLARRNKATPQEVQEAGAEDIRREWEKPLSEVEPKKERKPRLEKQKPASEKKEPAKEDAPAPEPIAPQEPKEAPRKGEAEQIVFINLSELHAFKNHPFGVHDDEEMRAMVESVKDKGVTQPATHEPIIDRLTWDCVQRRLDSTGRAHSNHTIKVNSTDEVNTFSGIIRCADCGAAMAFNRKVEKSGVVRRFYRCSRYANSGSKSCSMHTMDADTLESIILADIRYYAQTAISDEKKLYDRLLSFSGQEWQNEKAAQEKALRDATNRISFIQDASKRLFEEKITGNVSDSLFKNMLSDYEREINALEEKTENIRWQLHDQESSEVNVQKWMELIKDCVSIDRLDRATAFQLIDNVAVHEQTDESGHKSQSIQVKYNFVGCLS